MRYLIITADDFGRSRAVNEAVEAACRFGVLNAASLMVGGEAAGDAVERARRLPGLHVGLHLTVTRGRAILPPSAIPGLVDDDGRFRESLPAAGLAYALRPGVRAALEAEIRAQFVAYRATGLPLDHVDTHNHMLLHPAVLRLAIEAGRDHGLRAVRIPREPFLPSRAAGGNRTAARLAARLLLAPRARVVRQRLREAGIRHNDHLFGMHDTGRMDRKKVLHLLSILPEGVSELHFHPGSTADGEDRAAPDPERDALTCPEVAAAIRARGIRVVAYGDLPGLPPG